LFEKHDQNEHTNDPDQLKTLLLPVSAHVDVEPYAGQPVNHPQYNCKETRDKPEFANETIGNAAGVQNTPMLYGITQY